MSLWLLAAEAAEAAAHEPDFVRALLLSPLAWAMVLAAVGLWLVLPRGTLRGRRLGTLCSAASLVLLAGYLPAFGNLGERILFWLLASLTCASAIATVSMRSPVYSALSFALTLLGTSGLFLISGAQFLGVATVVVYAGAIVVTFLFVLMLAQPEGHAFYDRISWGPLPLACASVLAACIVGGLAYSLHARDSTLRYVAARLPDLQDANEQPLLLPHDLLGARLEAKGEGEYVLFLELRETENTAHIDARLLAAQLAEKAFELEPAQLQVIPNFVRAEDDHLASPDHVAGLGGELFSKHLISVEVAGTLLLAALVGAVAMIMQGRSRPAEEAVHA